MRVLSPQAPKSQQNYYHLWFLLTLGWMSLYMVRMIFTPALPFLMEEYGMGYTKAGVLATAVFWAYAGMQLPAGYLGDRIGRKPMLVLGVLAWSILCICTSIAYSLTALLLLRVLTGMAEGTYFGNDRAILAAYTPPERLGLAQGISMAGTGLGNFLGIFLGGLAAEAWGWRTMFLLTGLGSLAVAFLFFRGIREPERSRRREKRKFPLGKVVGSKDLWIIYAIGFAVMDVFWVFGVWAPSVLLELGVKTKVASALYASIFALCGVPGMILIGWASDSLLRRRRVTRKRVVFLMLALNAGLILAAGYFVEHRLDLPVFILLVGLSGFLIAGVFPPLYALIAKVSSPETIGATYGLYNLIAFTSATLAPILAGFLKDLTHSFTWSFYQGGILIAAAALAVLFVSGESKDGAAG